MTTPPLPPLPYPQMPGNDYTAADMHAHAQRAQMDALRWAAEQCETNAKRGTLSLAYDDGWNHAARNCAAMFRAAAEEVK